ncbi:hypothetical protein ACH4CE_29515 [Streptomyces gelaticus]|uniref:hypothetical protein n=1 Tax=Streptomyces gelaticus TaxID=285446 RepID=UPI00378F9BFF
MVDTAVRRFGADHIAEGARRNGVPVYRTVTIASIVPKNVAEFNRNHRSASGG